MMDASYYKDQGNKEMAAKNYESAIENYSKGIELDSSNHILYSNRSAVYASLGKSEEAIEDAKKVIELMPTWAKGYSRLGAGYVVAKRYDLALEEYEKGLSYEPENVLIKNAIDECQSRLNSMGDVADKLFSDPNMAKLFQDPNFLTKMQDYLKNPSAAANDPQFMEFMKHFSSSGMANQARQAYHDKTRDEEPKSKTESNPQKSKIDENSNEQKALAEKELGNAAYKKKDFELALLHYNKALELCPSDITFINNISEMGDFKKCTKECKRAIEVGTKNHCDYKLIARIGTVKHKQGKIQKAISYYNKSLSEYRDPVIVKKIKSIEDAIKKEAEEAYINPDIADEERTKGNNCFSSGKFPDAIKHYSESIKRNPKDPRPFANRAACFMKLMEYQLCIKDCDSCLEMDVKFIKAYLRKGSALLALKHVFQAQKCFEKALEIDLNCQEAKDGIKNCQIFKGKMNPDELRDMALKEPEIAEILKDPAMRLILEQMQTDPTAVRNNPEIAEKISKLMDAGIISVR